LQKRRENRRKKMKLDELLKKRRDKDRLKKRKN
jgi:hypothetical protein